jgi:hypothetical protein
LTLLPNQKQRGGLISGHGISMSFDQDPSLLISNVKRQSLRLRDSAGVPLKTARVWLAKYIYQEKDIEEIKRKLKGGLDSRYLYLSEVIPGCSEDIYRKYLNDKEALVKSLMNSPAFNPFDGNLNALLDKIFGV